MIKNLLKFLQEDENRYLVILIAMMFGLVFSKAILSISVLVLAINWLINKDLKIKLQKLKNNKPALAFLLIFLIHLIGLIYTTDFKYASKDIFNKLPLLVFVLVFATIKPFKESNFKLIINLLLFFITCSALISVYLFILDPVDSHRNNTPFMSHIRFGLLTSIASIILIFRTLKTNKLYSLSNIFQLAIGSFLGLFTIFIIGSLNATLIYFASFALLVFYMVIKTKKKLIKYSLLTLTIAIVLLPSIFLFLLHQQFHPPRNFDPSTLKQYTALGNKYHHDLENIFFENYTPVFVNISNIELEPAWNKRSKTPFNTYAENGFPITDVLYRYMASKGLTKDAEGMSKLSDRDVKNIEQGMTNYRLYGASPIESRVYEFLNGYYKYRYLSIINDNSLFMRFEFWKAARGIINDNFLFGVGTGDVNQAYKLKYQEIETQLDERLWHRAHNQFLSIAVAFGILGLIIFIFAIFYPAFKLKAFKSFNFLIIFVVLLISFLSEDTLETQHGVTIFAFLYTFFLFQNPEVNRTEISI